MIKGFTCGVFDILHPGYLIMLEEAKRNCDYLIVAIKTDPTIDQNHKAKPIQSLTERQTQLKFCKFVDEVICYDTEKDLENVLSHLEFDIRFIGVEYKDTEYTAKKICEDRNIKIHFTKSKLNDYSSENLSQRFKDRQNEFLFRNPYFAYFYYLGKFARSAKDGLFLEFGVYKGHSLKVIAKNTKNKVYGFDSFKGLPEAWQGDFGEGSLACEMPKNLPENTELVVGYFEETLEKFLQEHEGEITFIHVDCDIYSATKYLLEKCHDRMADQCIICFDDYMNYPGFEEHEYKAFNEYVVENNVAHSLICMYGFHQVAFKIAKNPENLFEPLAVSELRDSFELAFI